MLLARGGSVSVDLTSHYTPCATFFLLPILHRSLSVVTGPCPGRPYKLRGPISQCSCLHQKLPTPVPRSRIRAPFVPKVLVSMVTNIVSDNVIIETVRRPYLEEYNSSTVTVSHTPTCSFFFRLWVAICVHPRIYYLSILSLLSQAETIRFYVYALIWRMIFSLPLPI